MKILIAEDDPVSLLALSRVLEKNGHTPVAVTDGEKAVDAWRRGAFSPTG
jgi:CheY-like chemotaxis protein